MNIRTLGATDAEALSWLQTQTFQEAYADVHSAEDIERYCRSNFSVEQAAASLTSSAYLSKRIETVAQPIGFYTLAFSPCPLLLNGNSAELKQIYVLAAGYGTGAGLRLFEDAMDEFRVRGLDWVWLVVSDKNTRAKAFYQKLGFVRLNDGPVFEVGADRLTSSILSRAVDKASPDLS